MMSEDNAYEDGDLFLPVPQAVCYMTEIQVPLSS